MLFELMDAAIAAELGVSEETYKNIIETKCTNDEAGFIIMTLLNEDSDNIEKAKETFNKYL